MLAKREGNLSVILSLSYLKRPLLWWTLSKENISGHGYNTIVEKN